MIEAGTTSAKDAAQEDSRIGMTRLEIQSCNIRIGDNTRDIAVTGGLAPGKESFHITSNIEAPLHRYRSPDYARRVSIVTESQKPFEVVLPTGSLGPSAPA